MPLSTEVIGNKPLSGQELLEILVNEVRDLCGTDAMFRSHVGYGKVNYKITVDLKLNNPTYPEHIVRGREKTVGGGEDDPEAKKVTKTRSRAVESPNVARIANSLPVTVVSRQNGQTVEKDLHYAGKVEVSQPAPFDTTDIR